MPGGYHRGATYRLVCIQLAFGMCIPRTLVGKVGLKDGLGQPFSATGPSPSGSTGPRAAQVKTRTNFQVGQSVLCCSTKSIPTTCPPNKTPTPATTTVKSSLLGGRQSGLLCGVIICHRTTFLHQHGTTLFNQGLCQGCQGQFF